MTYTIVARDKEADQIGICMTTLTAATGAIGKFYSEKTETVLACQAYAEYGSSSRLVEFLDGGGSFSEFIKNLEKSDDFLNYKQIGMIDREGNISIYTGEKCTEWAGHIVGEDYLVFGNVLAGEHVVEAMAKAFEESRDDVLADRLLQSIEAGKQAGGQAAFGHSIPELSAVLRVHDYKADPFVFAEGKLPALDLRVDLDINPVSKLRRIYGPMSSLMEDYVKRYGRNPEEYVDSNPEIPELTLYANQF